MDARLSILNQRDFLRYPLSLPYRSIWNSFHDPFRILVDAAVAAGAELREDFSVTGLLWDGDQVTGIRGRAKGGLADNEKTRIVGADGLHSLVAAPSRPRQITRGLR
jgi:hypothetical protein